MSVTITSPASDTTCNNNQIPVAGTTGYGETSVTVSLFQNGNPVVGQQKQKANLQNGTFHYTFTNVAPGSGYSVTASGGSCDNSVINLTVKT